MLYYRKYSVIEILLSVIYRQVDFYPVSLRRNNKMRDSMMISECNR